MVRLPLALAALVALAPLAVAAPARAQAAAVPPALTTCVTCHDLTAEKKKLVGPPLFGIANAKPSISGVPYAKWDTASLDLWLKDPLKVKPTTLMTFSVGNPKKRAEVVKALAVLK